MWLMSICYDLKYWVQNYKVGIWEKLIIVFGGLIREEFTVLDLEKWSIMRVVYLENYT